MKTKIIITLSLVLMFLLAGVWAFTNPSEKPFEQPGGEIDLTELHDSYIQEMDENDDILSAMHYAFAKVESNNNPSLHDPDNFRVGIYQLTKSVIDSVNSWADWDFTYEDRFDTEISTLIFDIYQLHENPELDIFQAAYVMRPECSKHYRNKILYYYEEISGCTEHLYTD